MSGWDFDLSISGLPGNSNENGNYNWNWDITPPCNYGKWASTEKETVVTSKIDREYLVFGYGRMYHSKSIPNDILALCLNMFGLVGFSFNLQSIHLNKYHYYKSQIFCCNHMNFQIIIKKQESNSSWDFAGNSQRLYLYTNFTHPQLPHVQQKTAKIVALFTIYCKPLNKQFQSIINTSFDMVDNVEILTELDHSAYFRAEDLKSFESIQFTGNLDLIHVDILDTQHNILSVYHSNTKMCKRIEYKWTLNPSLNPQKKIYSSPLLDNNWRLVFAQVYAWSYELIIRLHLLSLPPNITSIDVLWHCLVECNGTSYANAKVETFGLNNSSISEFSWNTDDFGLKSGDAIHDISFITFIEIVNAQTRGYEAIIMDPDETTGNWSWGSSSTNMNLNSNKIANKNLGSYGIIDYDNDDDDDDDIGPIGICNNHRLLLQEQIQKVKQTKNRKNNSVNNSANINGFTFDVGSLLYIDNDTDPDNNTNNNESEVVEILPNNNNIDLPFLGTFNDSKEEEEEKEEEEKAEESLFIVDTNTAKVSNQINTISDEMKYNLGVDTFSPGVVLNDNTMYEWIEKTLKQISQQHYVNVLGVFKHHQVTDERLNDLESSDWTVLIPKIGIRNEMKKLFKQQKKKTELELIVSDSEL